MSLPQIAQLEYESSELEQATNSGRVHATFDWDFEAGDFKLKDGKVIPLTGIEYLKVWIKKALLTVKNTLIYVGTEYGSDHYSLVGRNFQPNFVKAELVRMTTEALMMNDAVLGVEGFEFSQRSARLTISFSVLSIYGTIEQESGVSFGG